MSEEQDKSQKTEQPTPKKLEDAKKKGKVAFSREINSFFLIVFFTLFVIWVSPDLMNDNKLFIGKYINFIYLYTDNINSGDISKFILNIMWDLILLIAIPLSISLLAIIVGSIIQNGLFFAPEALKFDLNRISPLAGIKRLFSLRSIVELIKSIIKIVIITTAVYLIISKEIILIKNFYDYDIISLISIFFTMMTKILITICIIMAFIAGIDFFYQKHDFTEGMKMTKQEVKDELKKTEGNPEIKAKLRSLRMEKAQKRMMAAVPDADVIITNPTHYSIALKYAHEEMGAPIVIAKGIDEIALRIRVVARENNVPLIENAPLARALYATVELDQEIPFEHYKAVAEIISNIMKIKR